MPRRLTGLAAFPFPRLSGSAVSLTLFFLTFFMPFGAGCASRGRLVPGPVPLKGAAIVVDAGEPPAVRSAAEDLRNFLTEAAGGEPQVVTGWDPGAFAARPARVFVGPRIAALLREKGGVRPADLTGEGEPAAEGYRIRAFPLGAGPAWLVYGGDERGVVNGVMALECRVRIEGGGATLSGDLDESAAPHFRRRGVYAHQHWAFNHPYALRTWTTDDWKRYVDLLGHLRYNLLQLWTMEGICPHPLTDGDRAFLRRYAPAIDRAHDAWAMQVWPGECANNIAETDKGRPAEEREYFDVEELKNPGDPKHLEAVLRCRRDLYESVPNGDGYWIIDSDPGGWPDSPPSEFTDLFLGNRRIIDEIHPRGKSVPLVYWMWCAWWGERMPKDRRAASWRAVLEDMKKRLPEPWLVNACWPEHLAIVKELGLLDRTILFPYGAGEPEPSSPYTWIRFDEIREAVRRGVDAGPLLGIMVNFQTPVVQLPNLYYFSRCAWDPREANTPDDVVLRELARLVAPRHAAALARAWILLAKVPPGSGGRACLDAAAALDEIEDPGPAGPVGRSLVGGVKQLVRDLATRIRIRGLALIAADAIRRRDAGSMENAVLLYLRAGFQWRERTGFHNAGWITGWDLPVVRDAWLAYLKEQSDPAIALARRLRDTLRADGNDPRVVDQAIREVLEVTPAHLLGAEAGFVQKWMILGPIPDPKREGLDLAVLDEPRFDLAAPVEAPGGRKLRWTEHASLIPAVALDGLFPGVQNAVAYAATAVECDRALPVEARAGSDDGLRVWINGKEVHRKAGVRAMEIDEDKFPATLKPGWNTVLVKVDQAAGDWRFCLRFYDKEGKVLKPAAEPARARGGE